MPYPPGRRLNLILTGYRVPVKPSRYFRRTHKMASAENKPSGKVGAVAINKQITSNATLMSNTVKDICDWKIMDAEINRVPFTHNIRVALDGGSLHLIQQRADTKYVLSYAKQQFRLLSVKYGVDEWSKLELDEFWSKHSLPSDTKNAEVLRYRITIQIVDNHPTVTKYLREINTPPKPAHDFPNQSTGLEYPLSIEYPRFYQVTLCFPNIYATRDWNTAQVEAFLKD